MAFSIIPIGELGAANAVSPFSAMPADMEG